MLGSLFLLSCPEFGKKLKMQSENALMILSFCQWHSLQVFDLRFARGAAYKECVSTPEKRL